jgi:integrase
MANRRKKEVVEISKEQVEKHGNKRWMLWTRRAYGGKPIKRYFEFLSDAEEERDKLLEQYHSHGAAAAALDAHQRSDAAKAIAKLDGRVNLEVAADFWLVHNPATPAPLLSEACAKFIEERRRWVADRRLRDLERRLERLSDDYPDVRVSQISEANAKEWLEKKHETRRAGQKGSAKLTAWGRNNYLRDLKMFFDWAVEDKGWCASNPFSRIKKDPVKRRDAPEIYSPEEAKKLIDIAIANPKLELLAYYTLGLFAGVRVAELGRVTWDMIDLSAKEITLRGKITKTYHPRTIALTDKVVERLRFVPNKTGQIVPVQDPKKRRYKLHRLAGVEFKPNGLRHSFASHHAKLHSNATELQMIMGQKTPSVLFDHYIASTKLEKAKAYFEI